MVAQSAVNRCVTGSSPVTGAIYKPSSRGGWFLKNPVVNWQGFVFLETGCIAKNDWLFFLEQDKYLFQQ